MNSHGVGGQHLLPVFDVAVDRAKDGVRAQPRGTVSREKLRIALGQFGVQ